jgi:hypothetical protein
MQSNPYPDNPNDRQPTEATPPMEPLQPRAPQYPQPSNVPPGYQNAAYRAQAQERQRAIAGQEKASTFAYGVAKFIDYLGWLILVLEVLLFLRFLLKLIGADPYNPFASFLYSLTSVFLFIFNGIVTDPRFGPNSVFEISTLIGMLVYGLIYWILRLLLRTTISRPSEPFE